MMTPPCARHGTRETTCVSRGIQDRLTAGCAIEGRVRPIYLAYLERGACFAIAYLTDDDYTKAEAQAAQRVVRTLPYAPDASYEAMLRELLAGDTPVLIAQAVAKGHIAVAEALVNLDSYWIAKISDLDPS